MKKLIIFLSLFASSIVSAQMKPLQDVMEGMDANEPTSFIYIAERSSALYIFSADNLPEPVKTVYIKGSVDFQNAAILVNMREGNLPKGETGMRLSAEEIQEKILMFLGHYRKQSEDHFLNSGERVNKIIESDLFVCKPVLESMRNQ